MNVLTLLCSVLIVHVTPGGVHGESVCRRRIKLARE